MKYIISKHYDSGNSTVQLSDVAIDNAELDNYDLYCEELESNMSVNKWVCENLCCEDEDIISDIAVDLINGNIVDISQYI